MTAWEREVSAYMLDTIETAMTVGATEVARQRGEAAVARAVLTEYRCAVCLATFLRDSRRHPDSIHRLCGLACREVIQPRGVQRRRETSHVQPS